MSGELENALEARRINRIIAGNAAVACLRAAAAICKSEDGIIDREEFIRRATEAYDIGR